jgi:hypothetical protein
LALCRSGRAGKALALPAAEKVTVAAGESFARAIVNKGGVVQLSLVLEAGAQAAVHVLNTANAYARIEIEVTCMKAPISNWAACN